MPGDAGRQLLPSRQEPLVAGTHTCHSGLEVRDKGEGRVRWIWMMGLRYREVWLETPSHTAVGWAVKLQA